MNGEALKVLRKSYNLSQAELGARLDPPVSRFAIINWEKENYAMPADIVEQLAKANLAAPAIQQEASSLVCRDKHPQCFRVESGRNGLVARTLAHPRWWAGAGSPFASMCDGEQWAREALQPTTVLELKTYSPITPDQALAIMVSRGVTDAAARQYLRRMGYQGFAPEIERKSMAEITGGEITDDSIGT